MNLIKYLIQNFESFHNFDASNITILGTPDDFRTSLIKRINESNRFYAACLYIGTDGNEKFKPVMEEIKKRVYEKKETHIKVDKMQKRRIASRFCQPLDQKIIENMEFVDEKPNLILPRSLKEALYVFHDKIFVFDDEVIITGANLYDDFFEEKIDRYYIIKNKNLADFAINEIFKKKSNSSTRFDFANNLVNTNKMQSQNPDILNDVLVNNNNLENIDGPINTDLPFTRIFHFSHTDEINVLAEIFSEKYEKVYISTPYMNFPQEYIDIIKHHDVEIFTVNPECLRFKHFGIFGKVVPNVYAYSIQKTKQYLPNSKISQYYKKVGGYHIKGMWLLNKDFGITILGSSNYNRRSFKRDHESCWMIISNDKKTLEKWGKEIEVIKKSCKIPSDITNNESNLSMIIAIMAFHIFNSFF